MSYDRANRFLGATQFSVVQVDPTLLAYRLQQASSAANQYTIPILVEGPTLDSPATLTFDLSNVEYISSYDMSVIGRLPNQFLQVPIDSASWNLKDGKLVINLEVPLGTHANALTYNIATAMTP